MSKNYEMLTEYLRNNNLILDKEVFKQTLLAMNIMSQEYITKRDCLNVVKEKFPSTNKSKISEMLSDMEFVGKAHMVKNKNYSKLISLNNEYSKRVRREK